MCKTVGGMVCEVVHEHDELFHAIKSVSFALRLGIVA